MSEKTYLAGKDSQTPMVTEPVFELKHLAQLMEGCSSLEEVNAKLRVALRGLKDIEEEAMKRRFQR